MSLSFQMYIICYVAYNGVPLINLNSVFVADVESELKGILYCCMLLYMLREDGGMCILHYILIIIAIGKFISLRYFSIVFVGVC